jgi:sialate O-acetylesterase
MKMFFKKAALSLLSLAVSVSVVQAKVTPNSLFGNNGVLQQGVEVPVWGTANDGEEVTVEFAGQKHVVKASNGKWLIKLKPLKASATPQDMLIKGENTVTIKNVLVGEVWLLSGQSNMAFPLRAIKPIGNNQALADVLKDANYPLIRQFSVPLRKSVTTPEIIKDVNGKWNVCSSTTAGNFSAVGYFFAKDLFKRLNVPIGLINSSYGGTAIENWISKETLAAFPELQSIITNYNKALKDFPIKLAEYEANEQKLIAEFKADSAYAAQQNKAMPRKPTAPMSPAERGGPTGLYNTMIHPLIPYAMKGSVWYQGEANGSRGKQYRTLLPALINSWRAEWGLGDFPFIIVQIPGWKAHQPELREAQLLTWKKIKNTAMTVITDVDDTLDVHPGNKQPVGERVALQARAIAYQDKIVYAGPVYESMKIEGNQAILSFSHVGKGLVVKGTELKDFIIAGADKKFHPAKAVIKGDKIIVSADAVKTPVAVRMGWRICPDINLYNKEGLCAAAFRTDID